MSLWWLTWGSLGARLLLVLLLLLFAMVYFMSTSMKLGYTIAIPSGPKVRGSRGKGTLLLALVSEVAVSSGDAFSDMPPGATS